MLFSLPLWRFEAFLFASLDFSLLYLSKVEERVKEEDEIDTRRGKVIKFGWIEGVLMRCMAILKRGIP